MPRKQATPKKNTSKPLTPEEKLPRSVFEPLIEITQKAGMEVKRLVYYPLYPLKDGAHCRRNTGIGREPNPRPEDSTPVDPLTDNQKKLVLFFTNGHCDMPKLAAFIRRECNAQDTANMTWRDIIMSLIDYAEAKGIDSAVIHKYPKMTFNKWRLEKEAAAGKTQERRTPLGKRAAMLYEYLRSLPEHEAKTTPELLEWWSQTTGREIDEGALRDVLEELKPYGLKNKPRVGFYIDRKIIS